MLRIRLAIADTDETYVNRLANYYNVNYGDKLEVISFTNKDLLISFLQTNKLNVLLANESFELNTKQLDSRLAFAYLVDSQGIATLHGKKTVCKFQKPEMIYKEVLNLYSEIVDNTGVIFKLPKEGETKVITFLSSSGGVGSSTLAAACSINLVNRSKRVLYLNLEQFGSTNVFFNASGAFSLSDIFYAVKNKKSNLSLKIESTVKRDDSGVFFYDSCKTPLDIFEMTSEEINTLLMEIRKNSLYDHIVIDANLVFNETLHNLINASSNLVLVSDGSEVSNVKFKRVYEALNLYENHKGSAMMSKVSIIYNQFKSGICRQVAGIEDLNVLGYIGQLPIAPSKNIAIQIANTEVFNQF